MLSFGSVPFPGAALRSQGGAVACISIFSQPCCFSAGDGLAIDNTRLGLGHGSKR